MFEITGFSYFRESGTFSAVLKYREDLKMFRNIPQAKVSNLNVDIPDIDELHVDGGHVTIIRYPKKDGEYEEE